MSPIRCKSSLNLLGLTAGVQERINEAVATRRVAGIDVKTSRLGWPSSRMNKWVYLPL